MNLQEQFCKQADFVVQSETPFNGNPPLAQLCEQFQTPTELFFVRNHGDVPQIDAADYHLCVTGKVKHPLMLSLEDVRRNFPKREQDATLQCAGNRRDELIAYAPIPGELPWGAGAISHTTWGGAWLCDVLQAAGLEDGAAHIAFTGLDTVSRLERTFGFGGSIPLEKALDGHTLLAYEMNGAPLSPVHGFPLRVIVPGYIGARSVKWLAQISVQDQPSDNYFQRRAYNLYPQHMTAENVDWDAGMMLGANPLNAVIASVQPGQTIPAGQTVLRGYALGAELHRLERVEISIDGGQNWIQAELDGEEAQGGVWRLWQAAVELPPGEVELVARAWDTSGEAQPPDIKDVWNFKGYLNTAWHRVCVLCQP